MTMVSVVGLGYIGLPTAALIASRGTPVAGVDTNSAIVDMVNRGAAHVLEPGLDEAVRTAVAGGHLTATTEPRPADVFLIAVPTPFREGYHPDLSYIEQASRAVAGVLKPGNLVILESTSPVGATERMCEWLAEVRPDLTFPHQAGERSDVRVAYCPERVLPGQVMEELVRNDRIVGGMTPACAAAAAELYGRFVEGDIVRTDVRTAEMTKLTENAFRDLNIAFANELSIVCDRLGLDVWELIRLANHHPRVNILQPGVGVGGHCIAVDPWFLISNAPDITPLMRAARDANESKSDYVLREIQRRLAEADRPVLACLGLTFKPDVHDLRSSPALRITQALALDSKVTILVVEPHIEALPPELESLANVELTTFEDAISRAGIIAALVKHRVLSEACASCDMNDDRFLDFVNIRSRSWNRWQA